MGPHPEFELRGPSLGTPRGVELPYWWDCLVDPPGSEERRQVEVPAHEGLHVRYDRGLHAARLEDLRRRVEAERVREAELAELHRLAEKYGMVLRPRLGSSSARVEVEHVGFRAGSVAPSPLGGGEHTGPGAVATGQPGGHMSSTASYREGEKRIPRRAHNPETAGSTPALATREPVGVS